jgi:hypothetical protein
MKKGNGDVATETSDIRAFTAKKSGLVTPELVFVFAGPHSPKLSAIG